MKRLPVPHTLDATGQDVHAEGTRLREAGTATLVALPGDVVAWAVTSLSGLRELLTDSRISKDPRQHWPQWINCEITPEWPLFTWVAVQNMLTAYGADHKRLRSLSAKAFTARNIAAQRPRIEKITADLVNALAAHPAGEAVDLRESFAFPLPIEVISQLFGVPDTMRAMLRKVVDGLFDTSLPAGEAQANQARLYPLLNELIGIKREAPADDMTSALIAARDDDANSRLSEAELADTLVLMLSAGHETTVNLLDQAIAALLTHPGQLDLVRSGENSWDDVIEEALRWQAPIPFVPLRFAVEDIDFHGVIIRKGDAIIGAYDAANRSPEANGQNADEFDITRRNKDYVTFGYGVHYCLGAPLAKLEARIALPALFERFPNMSLAIPPAELRPVGSFVSNGHRTLPVLL
ncbi:MAG: cytochrome monooxygenase [Pseudonocardia sp.]|jgi:cytochrome P450|uniref:cytochrome P450 family protein n=1 Tax=Pseudonocardia sp. TaxID=60912 RepID=UPI00262F43B6|nr:cytochrome P450 [Pseudonocardia sp.]MCU1626409.1 cytochrome monooxygenase [Pseudonocardia sp.]MDT7701951.1 2-hydroxy-5-methyl-naphthoate 7-hydroxylase [Pseudonocardiales bacterium]